jgi:opacity protein-like surface antigen
MTRSVPYMGFALALVLGSAGGAAGQTTWDSEDRRSGFVIGFSLGPALTLVDFEDPRFAIATDLRVGGEVGKRTQIYYLNQVSFFNPGDRFVNDVIAVGLTGIGLTFAASPRAMVSLGAGFASWTELADRGWSTPEFGWGGMAGVAYEFADLWLADLSVGYAVPDFGWGTRKILTVKVGIGILGH